MSHKDKERSEFILPEDIAAVAGVTIGHAYKIIAAARELLGKRKKQPITVDRFFADYYGLDQVEIEQLKIHKLGFMPQKKSA